MAPGPIFLLRLDAQQIAWISKGIWERRMNVHTQKCQYEQYILINKRKWHAVTAFLPYVG
jgi:hypothetical protein